MRIMSEEAQLRERLLAVEKRLTASLCILKSKMGNRRFDLLYSRVKLVGHPRCGNAILIHLLLGLSVLGLGKRLPYEHKAKNGDG